MEDRNIAEMDDFSAMLDEERDAIGRGAEELCEGDDAGYQEASMEEAPDEGAQAPEEPVNAPASEPEEAPAHEPAPTRKSAPRRGMPVFSMDPVPGGSSMRPYDDGYDPDDFLDFEAAWHSTEQFDYVIPAFRHPGVGVLAAQGGTGKSMLALLLLVFIALGRDGFRRRGCIYLSAEDDRQSLNIRLRDLMIAHGITDEERKLLQRNLVAWGCMGLDVDAVSDEPGGNVLQRKIRSIVERHPWESAPEFLVIDTLRMFSPEIENSNDGQAKAMKAFFRMSRDNGLSVLVLHHISKNAALNGLADTQQAVRGGGAIVDNSRFVANLVGLGAEEMALYGLPISDLGKYVRYHVSKASFAEPPADIFFKRDHNGILSRADLKPKSAPDDARKGDEEYCGMQRRR